MNKISTALALPLLLLSACSHSVTFRASHFATPIVADEQWSGQLALVGTSVTKVTVINDSTSNPPLRNSILINSDVDVADLLLINRISADARLTVWDGFEGFIDGSLLGVRYQFLNHKAAPQNWVAAAHIGRANRNESSGTTTNTTAYDNSSDIQTTQLGLSVGYKLEDVVPYFSYIHESHQISTKISGSNGTFGPYKDDGVHQYFALGLTSYKKGIAYGIEYNLITIDWKNSTKTNQDALGFKIGGAW